ncbi:DUF5591 domain-containing protein [Methanocaldococcus indicus]|uniref:DUF5591 domain-containing protein n=1 Tax=Methanocaldococcus indicus TaxID=213231 RepID=UPI003C6D3917
MLEVVAYDIGRVCKDKNNNETPSLISFDFDDYIAMPYDCEDIYEKFEKSFIFEKDNIKYQILNYGKYLEKAEIKKADIYVLIDSRILIQRKELIHIKEIRQKISPNSAILFPSVYPWEIPLLVYLGVDYFTDLSDYLASLGYRLTKNRAIKSDLDFEELREINKKVYEDILLEVREAIKNGYLRNVVEETSISHPYLWANYKRYKPDLRFIPLSKENKVIVTANINVPEVEKYLERLEFYEPFSNVVVLLPCSAKKPYSTSKSHRIFKEYLKGFTVEEVVLTSPYGLVPRALERVVNYDIPVTGEWSYEEKELINRLLKSFIENVKKKFGDCIVIAHLPKHYYEILEIDCIKTGDNPLSKESLNNLRKILNEYKDITKNKSKKEQIIHNIKELAKFQFEIDFIPDDIKINRKEQIFYNNRQIASINQKNGLLVLTYYGGELLWNKGFKDSYYIEVSYDIKKGTLFPPGFVDCNDSISYKDEVIFIKEDEYLGVGRALMPGIEMKKAEHGGLAIIRKVK